jgi:hypothetical protein
VNSDVKSSGLEENAEIQGTEDAEILNITGSLSEWRKKS